MNKDIDREIAEKVMGWMLGGATVDPMSCPVWWDVENKKIAFGLEDWRPVEDIVQAFEVVEKMHQKGFYLKLRGPFMNPDDWEWYCYFELHTTTDTHPLWTGRADTPAMAICLAALKGADGDGESGGDEGV